MNYSRQQVLDLIDISPQTFRYWRKTLPPLHGRSSYTACFSFADLLALKIVSVLAHDCGIAISSIARCADGLFHVCRLRIPIETMRQMKVIIFPIEGTATVTLLAEKRSSASLEISIPLLEQLDSLISELQQADELSAQFELRLPPTPLKSKRA